MFSCKTKCMIRILTIWNQLMSIQHTIKNWYNYTRNEIVAMYKGSYHIWALGPNQNPIPLSYHPPSSSWHYHKHQLTYQSEFIQSIYRYSWLSATICDNENNEYDMDDFLNKFRVSTDMDECPLPTIQVLIQSWSIENQIWFKDINEVTLRIIDHTGDVCIITNRPYLFYTDKQKIYLVNEKY